MKTYRDQDYRFVDENGKEYISTPELDLMVHIQLMIFIIMLVCGSIVTILNGSF